MEARTLALGARPSHGQDPGTSVLATVKSSFRTSLSGCDFALCFSSALICLDSSYMQALALRVLVSIPEEASS